MSYGFQLINEAGISQLDENYVCAHEIASGYSGPRSPYYANEFYEIDVEIPSAPPYDPSEPYANAAECVVFVKPVANDKFVGGMTVYCSYDSSGSPIVGGYPRLRLHGQCAFYYKVFHLRGTPTIYADSFGMEIFKLDGGLCYTTKKKYPAVFHCVATTIRANAASLGGEAPLWGDVPTVVAIPSIGEIPWIMANSLPWEVVYGEESAGIYIQGAAFGVGNDTLKLARFELLDVYPNQRYFAQYPISGGLEYLPQFAVLARIPS